MPAVSSGLICLVSEVLSSNAPFLSVFIEKVKKKKKKLEIKIIVTTVFIDLKGHLMQSTDMIYSPDFLQISHI